MNPYVQDLANNWSISCITKTAEQRVRSSAVKEKPNTHFHYHGEPQSPFNSNVAQQSLLGLVPHPLLHCSWGYFLWCPLNHHDVQLHGELLLPDLCDASSEPTRRQHWTELCKRTGAKNKIQNIYRSAAVWLRHQPLYTRTTELVYNQKH